MCIRTPTTRGGVSTVPEPYCFTQYCQSLSLCTFLQDWRTQDCPGWNWFLPLAGHLSTLRRAYTCNGVALLCWLHFTPNTNTVGLIYCFFWTFFTFYHSTRFLIMALHFILRIHCYGLVISPFCVRRLAYIVLYHSADFLT